MVADVCELFSNRDVFAGSDVYVMALVAIVRFACVIVLSAQAMALFLSSRSPSRKQVKHPGDFMLETWIEVHRCNPDCSSPLINPSGVQQLEAVFYALDLINADGHLLPNASVGFQLTDAINLETLWSRLLPLRNQSRRIPIRDDGIVGIIDGKPEPRDQDEKWHYLGIAEYIGRKAFDVQIPQISYASTGIDLSDKTRFEYFSRVVPPDTYQAQAMVDVVKAFNWTYVSTLADTGNYGEKGIDTFKAIAEKNGICVAKSLEIPREPTNDTFLDIVTALADNGKAKVVVLFVNEDNCQKLVKASLEKGHNNDLYWLASDSWGAKEVPVRGQELAAEGTVTILPQREVVKEFDAYFTKLNPTDNYRNPWFREFWERHFKCSLEGDTYTRRCTGLEKLTFPGYQQEGIVPFVIDAVYAMAHALHNMLLKECGGPTICKAMEPPSGPKLLQYIRNVTFTGVAGQTIKFNKNGDAMGRYTIYQFQRRPNGRFEYVPIGNWSDTLSIDLSLTKWKPTHVTVPKSVCSEPCPPGHMKRNDDALDKCCWVCIRCGRHMILKDENTCEPCPNGTYPDPSQTRCEPLPVDYMTFDSVWAIVPVVVASVGILSTIFIAAVFIKFNNTPVIMASGRELCYVLMVGLLFSYMMTFVMVAKPTVATCCLTRVGLGLSLSMCYAALFTKTNRISRIFNRGVKAMVKRPSYTSPKSQLVICSCLVAVQIIAAITWVGMDLPDTALVYPDRRTVVLRCKSTNVAIILSLLYNMILITLCTVYAFKTRKIPENFNEAKHIAFTMYSTCIVWLAFIPIYFGTNKSDFRIQITALCMCVSISASVALACLFVPKVYIVLFQPHKNVRQGAHGSLGSGAPGRPFFGRPSTRFSSLAAMNGDITSPTGLALLIAQGSTPKPQPTAQTDSDKSDKGESLRDLDSSGADNSDPETNV